MSTGDITEDGGLQDLKGVVRIEEPPLNPEHAHPLYSPLPQDLPAVNKDVLILTAAWEGNIDSYARLQRPHMIRGEDFCAVRGIHHSTAFARWWSRELGIDLERELTQAESVDARAIFEDKEPTSTFLHGLASAQLMDMDEGQDLAGETGFYGDAYLTTCGSSKIDVFICATEESRAQAAEEEAGWMKSLEVAEDED